MAVSRDFLADDEIVVLQHIADLIRQGEKLLSVRSHPGKTLEFIEWRDNIEALIYRRYGNESHYVSKLKRVICFPQWFDPKKHGPMQAIAVVETDAEASDRETAFRLYKEGLQDFLSILKSMSNDIKVNGLPPEASKDERLSPSIHANFNPQFNQSQNQSQAQHQSLTFDQQIEKTVKKIEEQYGGEQAIKAKEMLEEVKKNPGKWGTLQKVIKYCSDLGKEATIALIPVLVQILLKK